MVCPTVKLTPLLATPATVTTTLPVVAPLGTGATMLVAVQLEGVAAVPLNVTVLLPWVVPKVVPAMVTEAPTAPETGDKLAMCGVTVKLIPLLATPPTVTATFPVVAPLGTGATILVADQLVGVAAVLLNITVLPFWVAPKPVPVMVTEAPTAPKTGDKLVMCGVTVKLTPLLATPPTVTTTLPVVAALGTGTTMDVALQLVGVAVVPLNFTVLLPLVAPKLVPMMVTEVPTAPETGDKPVMFGADAETVKLTPLLATPPTVTTTFPVVAPFGTGTTMEVSLQFVGVAAVPLNVTVLLPCVVPKLVPVTVTEVPATPEPGDKLAMCGVTVKLTPLLATPPTVTTTLPVVAPLGTEATILVADQLVGVAVVLSNITVLPFWVVAKPVPAIVTEVPTAPETGDKLVMLGITVKLTALLATPPTVTTTLPVVAALGTGTTMEVALQLVTVAVVPLNVTVLLPWVVPKPLPAMVTAVATTPEAADKLVICGVTVKLRPLLATPLTVTTTLPVVAAVGTGTTMDVALQLVTVAEVLLKVTVPDAPKLVPEIVTDVPTIPEEGDKLMMLGAVADTVKFTPLLATPPTVTMTLPLVAPLGTGTTMLVAVQLVGVAEVPLNVTALLPWVVPKPVPAMVTEVPTAAEVGDKLVMLGVTVKLTPLLATPPTVTTTLPVVAALGTGTTMEVALQLVTVAVVPLNVTVLPFWVVPKPVPAMVTDVPTIPEAGDRLVIFGVTVKLTPLLARPPTVTTTLPVAAALGTGTTMEVALQLVAVAEVPLKVTVPDEPKFVPEIVTEVPTVPEAGDKPVILGGGLLAPAVPLPYTEAGQLCQVAVLVQVAGKAFSPVALPTLLQAVPSSRKRTMFPLTPSIASQ
jgi:hypothetical protein